MWGTNYPLCSGVHTGTTTQHRAQPQSPPQAYKQWFWIFAFGFDIHVFRHVEFVFNNFVATLLWQCLAQIKIANWKKNMREKCLSQSWSNTLYGHVNSHLHTRVTFPEILFLPRPSIMFTFDFAYLHKVLLRQGYVNQSHFVIPGTLYIMGDLMFGEHE